VRLKGSPRLRCNNGKRRRRFYATEMHSAIEVHRHAAKSMGAVGLMFHVGVSMRESMGGKRNIDTNGTRELCEERS
jgi:hypothetical protein